LGEVWESAGSNLSILSSQSRAEKKSQQKKGYDHQRHDRKATRVKRDTHWRRRKAKGEKTGGPFYGRVGLHSEKRFNLASGKNRPKTD